MIDAPERPVSDILVVAGLVLDRAARLAAGAAAARARTLVPRLERGARMLEHYDRSGEVADLVLQRGLVARAFPNRRMPHPTHPNPLVTLPQGEPGRPLTYPEAWR